MRLVLGQAKTSSYGLVISTHAQTFVCRHLGGHLVVFAIQVEVAAAGDDKTAEAKVEQELLQVRKKKGGLKVRA